MSENSFDGGKVAIGGELSEFQQQNVDPSDTSINNAVLKALHLDSFSGDALTATVEEAWEKRVEEDHQTHDVQQHEAEREIMAVLQSLGLDPNSNNLDQLANELEPVEAWEVKAERTHSADEIDHENASKEVNAVLDSLGLSAADLLQPEPEEWEIRAEKQHAEVEIQRAEAEKEIDVVLQTLGMIDSALYTENGIVIDDIDDVEVWEIKAQAAHNDEVVQRAVASEEIHLVLESCGIVDDHTLNEQELFDLNLATEAWELKADEYALHRPDNEEVDAEAEASAEEEEADITTQDVTDNEEVTADDISFPQQQEIVSELTMSALLTLDAPFLENSTQEQASITDAGNATETELSLSTTAAATVGTESSPFPEDNVLSSNNAASSAAASVDIPVNAADIEAVAAAEVATAPSESVSSPPASATKEKKSMFSYIFGSSSKKK